MIRKILPLILIFCSLSMFAQNDLTKGFIVLESHDTIAGQLKNKKYYTANGVKLYQKEGRKRYPKRILTGIHLNADTYVKGYVDDKSVVFLKKDIAGYVNVYTYKNRKKLGAFDTDISSGRLIPAIRFYCNDYPHLSDTIKYINKDNIDEFITEYNNWKTMNPVSKSYFEKNIHKKPFLNLKLSFFLPGAGVEFGIDENLALSTMLKNEIGYGGSEGLIINPFFDTQFRYFYGIEKMKKENKRTYKYTGKYFCLVDGYFIKTRLNFIGFEYGWQGVINKHWYYNAGFGGAKWTTENLGFIFLYDLDLGFNF
jgi:hypothetical protein